MSTMDGIEVLPAPPGLENEYSNVLTSEALAFIGDCYRHFQQDIQTLHDERVQRQLVVDRGGPLPSLTAQSAGPPTDWTVAPLPARLRDRRLDLGDVSPADRNQLETALSSGASGVQVDFDDGHCPTWRNQLLGWHHVLLACRGQLVPASPQPAPLLVLRPRAWNMTEHNVLVDGSPVPGAVVDFCVVLFHCGRQLAEAGLGPALYLPKLEAIPEARLWDDIFNWTERRLQITPGAIRGCLMIENILAAFDIEGMLYELRDHSLGLNCGMWDYTASFLKTFRRRAEFVMPDRAEHIKMSAPFLANYLRHAIDVGRRRHAPVTAGMTPYVLPDDPDLRKTIIESACSSKRAEIAAGVDGFLAFDPGLVPALMQLWTENIPRQPQPPDHSQLLAVPRGGVTSGGLRENVRVSLLFIRSWLAGRGVFVYRGRVEDSAMAEISRSQLWQWCRYRVTLADSGVCVSLSLILAEMEHSAARLLEDGLDVSAAVPYLRDLTCSRDFVPFITTFLSQQAAVMSAV